jgi:hypothetical protein
MNLTININIPDLWGEQIFQRNEWGVINYLVGPNATGKTRFAEQLKIQCQNQGLHVRSFSSDRLTGFEKQPGHIFGSSNISRGLDTGQYPSYISQSKDYGLSGSAFIVLKNKVDLRIRIEAILSQLFNKKIRLAEEGGFLIPKIQRVGTGGEYGLRESECHGLKELIPLLTFLFDDENDCMIIDEPEQHLHPQFQTFFLQMIREIAGDPRTDIGKKCFFIITHSPYFVDIRTVSDLKNCLVFQPEKIPQSIKDIGGEDEHKIKRLIPRLNVHHKQFFFASRPIFVEGYFDQQIFSLIQEKRGRLLGASGSCIIDVGGKDELDLFFRLCKNLDLNAQFIGDLDVIFKGKLRQSVSLDRRCQNYVHQTGLGIDLMNIIGEAETKIGECLSEFEPQLATIPNTDLQLKKIQQALSGLTEIDKKRYVFLIGLNKIGERIKSLIPSKVDTIQFIEGRIPVIIEAFKTSGVFILSDGELENYLPEYEGDPYQILDINKIKVFEKERDFILENDLDEPQINSRYGKLAKILDDATSPRIIDMDLFITNVIRDWIFKVQMSFNRGEIKDMSSLKGNTILDWQTYSRIFDLLDFTLLDEGFNCKIKFKKSLDPREREFTFNNLVSAANFQLP